MTYCPKLFVLVTRALSRRPSAVLPAALIAFLLLAWSTAAVRADDDDDDEPANPQPAGQQAFVLVPETFDQWVFGGVVIHGGPNNNAANQMDQRCQSLLDMRIDAIDRVCTLSEAQQKKLRLAASGDIKRFSDQYDQLKQKYLNTKQDPNNINQVFVALQPLQQAWQTGIFGDQSLFKKVIANTLQQQQLADYQHEEAARNNSRYLAKIKLAVISLDNLLGLTDAQRQEFEKLLAETPPPKKFGQYDYYYVITQVARLPEEKLKSILDARQLKIIQPIIQRNKGFEQMLKQQGVM
jgi:hypothetical protein